MLISDVETAIAAAARKAFQKKEDIIAKVDTNTGQIRLYAKDEEINVTPEGFGRIAAQTAKQVIIQKLKERERDVIYEEFKDKIGDIVGGGIHRFDKTGIIVDMGKTEALIPRNEQSPKEDYRQGSHIRAYVVDVKKTPKGTQIILSRTHPGFVRKLFELEVPEILDGLVEIKSISREPGSCTKIAVFSKDEKVDCVGSCVGMRGSRVKNIVRELQGEKVDIVRYSEEPQEFITAALGPAKILSMKLDEKNKKAEVITADDQLSLAIGRHGQNVRLAAKLTSWHIDIRSEQEVARKPKEKELLAITGVGSKLAEELIKQGFDTVEKIVSSSIEELMKVAGVGKKTAEKILKSAKELIETKDKVEAKDDVEKRES
ncbi:MAG: transcription termination/antitermination protein NusA [Candidatus Omnitrophica bacterium]|nr:transcription termination/antitermination protein NusA [Candidatus Omnitrophota bacterium]